MSGWQGEVQRRAVLAGVGRDAVAERERGRCGGGGDGGKRSGGAEKAGEGHGGPETVTGIDLDRIGVPHAVKCAADRSVEGCPLHNDAAVILVALPKEEAGGGSFNGVF